MSETPDVRTGQIRTGQIRTGQIRTGQCLCGAVTLTARLKTPTIHACHCKQCQRWTGGGPLYVVEVDALDISGTQSLLSYQASDWGERAVCAMCGSPVWWKMQDKVPNSIALGLLDDQSGLSVAEEIFVDYRPCWLSPYEGASQSTEAEELAKLKAALSN